MDLEASRPNGQRATKQRIAAFSRNFEAQVRLAARLLWNRDARQETINNVVYDVVLPVNAQHWIILEATISRDLDKVRIDLNRLSLARLALVTTKNIITELFLVILDEPTPDMIATGRGMNVEILSLSSLRMRLFDFISYETQRNAMPFGSAVLPQSGERDTSTYVPVSYLSAGSSNEVSIDNVCSRLSAGEQMVLVGEYGTGKSRCLQETFNRLAVRAESSFRYPLAINLRDCWGLETGEEILGRHFRRLGLSHLIDNVVRLLNAGSIVLLLDGFDELGIQSWTDDLARLQEIRKRALRGVRDLISNTRGGILVAGREHYFDSNNEMLSDLGLSTEISVFKCKIEFTVPEMREYLKDRDIDRQPPEWLPRRPLMVQILSSFDPRILDEVLSASSGVVKFWHLFVSAFCKREAGAKDTMLDGDSVQRVMQMLARLTRTKPSDVGPLTQTEIRNAFESVIGTTAIDESRVILQRLSGLGRVSSESDDRQFVDPYLLDGFRALDVNHIVSVEDKSCQKERWINPLRPLGQLILGDLIADRKRDFMLFAKHSSAYGNAVLAGDIVGSVCVTASGPLDFNGVQIQTGYFHELDFHTVVPSNLIIHGSVIHRLIAPREIGEGFMLNDCDIEVIFGEQRKYAAYMTDCRVDFRKAVALPLERLDSGQRVLMEILTGLWEARGKSAPNAVIRRRASKIAPDRIVGRVMDILIGEEEIVLPPGTAKRLKSNALKLNRHMYHRVVALLRDMHLSTDPVWSKVSNLV